MDGWPTTLSEIAGERNIAAYLAGSIDAAELARRWHKGMPWHIAADGLPVVTPFAEYASRNGALAGPTATPAPEATRSPSSLTPAERSALHDLHDAVVGSWVRGTIDRAELRRRWHSHLPWEIAADGVPAPVAEAERSRRLALPRTSDPEQLRGIQDASRCTDADLPARYAAAAAWIRSAGSPPLRQALAAHEAVWEPDPGPKPCVQARRRREVLAAAVAEGFRPPAPAPKPAAPAVPTAVDLVVPLGDGSKHDDIEVRYLMRSARRNLRGLRTIHVVGHRRPAWLRDAPGFRWHDWRRQTPKDHDIVAKFLYAARHPDISATFVAACDDWLFLAPITPGSDWGAVQRGGVLTTTEDDYWSRAQAGTRRLLDAAGKGHLFYDTHTPSVMTTVGWELVDQTVPWRDLKAIAVWSLYHNIARPAGPEIGRDRKVAHGWHSAAKDARGPADSAEIDAALDGMLFTGYNDTGLTPALQTWLAARFPIPAPWEADVPEATQSSEPVAVTARGPVGPMEASVTVTCHPPYLGSLRACLQSIDRQTLPPVQRLLCLDGIADVPSWIAAEFPAWTIERGDWHSPNPGRNLGWQRQGAPWTWYMDADNVAHPEYLAGAAKRVGDRVGIVHADLAYTTGKRLATPDGLDYWGMRLRNYVDTAAVWRRDAVREAGGWRMTERWDDWDLALRVTAAGWHTARNSVPILFTIHQDGADHRNAHTGDMAHKWGRSYGIVCLLAGRSHCWQAWTAAFLAHDLPDRCTVYLVDDSRSAEFARDLALFRDRLEGDRGVQVQVLRPAIPPDGGKTDTDRHRRVCRLYNAVVPRVIEDVMWTWEDDNVPRTPAAGREICQHWEHTRCGGICAMYESRWHPGRVCASPATDYWRRMRSLTACRGKLHKGWGFLPGGFALWHTPLVRAAMPFCVTYPDGHRDSWDGKLSRTVRSSGFRLDLDGLVEVDHLVRPREGAERARQ